MSNCYFEFPDIRIWNIGNWILRRILLILWSDAS